MEFTHSNPGLFVVADDLGLNDAINDGIFFALKNGLIDGASLMPNGEAFSDAIQRLKDLSHVNVGVHLVLVEEKPTSDISEVGSLAAKDGYLHKNHKIFFIRYVLGLIDKNEIYLEIRAQIKKCVEAGIKPIFINSHQHLHLLPSVMDMTIRLAKEFGVPYIRVVTEPVGFDKDKLFRRAQLLFLNFLSWLAKKKIKKVGLRYNDFFIGFTDAGNLNIKSLSSAKKLQKMYPEKIIELGCHPGFENQELVEKYKHWHYHWKKEIEVLKTENDENK